MSERQSRAYAIVQELRLLGGFAEFTFDAATTDNLRSAKTPSNVQYFGFERADGARFSIHHYPGWGKKAGDISFGAGKIDELWNKPEPPLYRWKDTNTRRTDYDIAGAIAAARPTMAEYWQAGLRAKADAIAEHAALCALADRIAQAGAGKASYGPYQYNNNRIWCSGSSWSIDSLSHPNSVSLKLLSVTPEEAIAIVTMLATRRKNKGTQL
jgi:hypothetical protein